MFGHVAFPMTNVCYDSIVESGRGNHHSLKLRLKQKIEIQNGLKIQIQFKIFTKGVTMPSNLEPKQKLEIKIHF